MFLWLSSLPCCSVSLSPSSLPLCVSLQQSRCQTSALRGRLLEGPASITSTRLSAFYASFPFAVKWNMYFVYCIRCVCICFLSLPLFTLSVLSLSLSFSSVPGRLSAGRFLRVSRVLLKVSSCSKLRFSWPLCWPGGSASGFLPRWSTWRQLDWKRRRTKEKTENKLNWL